MVHEYAHKCSSNAFCVFIEALLYNLHANIQHLSTKVGLSDSEQLILLYKWLKSNYVRFLVNQSSNVRDIEHRMEWWDGLTMVTT